MQALVIISGTSGAGKTVQLRKLEKNYGHGRVVTITTRPPRDDEPRDAYHFVSDERLTKLESQGKTIWVTGRYGNQYSITEEAIWGPIKNNNGLAFVVITPDYHARLADWCKKNSITPINIHLVAPEPKEQKQRLLQRDGIKFDPDRIDATNKFETDAKAAAAQVQLHCIEQGTPETMFAQLRTIIDALYAP